MRFGSLFAGIGGIDLGLERAGMECAWQVEIDDYATRALEKHWPDVARFRDIREVGAANLAPVDLICGGFPCQPHSLAGKRKGSEDERDLWGEMFRVICEVKPRWVLAENVPGLLSSEAGRYFGRILRDLVGVGFDVEWESIPAAAVGAPHGRDRVYIVAYANGYGWNDANDRECGYERTQECNGIPSKWSPHRFFSGLVRPSDSRLEKTRWRTESRPLGVADGVPSRVDRLRSLGNAVVPQVAEWIGRRIVECQNQAGSTH